MPEPNSTTPARPFRGLPLNYTRIRDARDNNDLDDDEVRLLFEHMLTRLDDASSTTRLAVHSRLTRLFPDQGLEYCDWFDRTVMQETYTDINGNTVCEDAVDEDGFYCHICDGLDRNNNGHDFRGDYTICQRCVDNGRVVWSDRHDHYVRPEDLEDDDDEEDISDDDEEEEEDFAPFTNHVIEAGRSGLDYTPNVRKPAQFDPKHTPADFWQGPVPGDIPRGLQWESFTDEDDLRLLRNYSHNVLNRLPGFRYMPGELLPLNPLWLGVELEVEPRLDAPARYIRHIHNTTKDFAILKTDGSLGRGGVEIVSVPATLEFHRNAWLPFFNEAAKYLRSWTTGRCGLHVHISRAALTNLQAGRMIVFVNEPGNLPFISAIAGRGPGTYNQVHKKRLTDEHRYRDHYEALHTSSRTGGATMELRIFRGNVQRAGFFRSLEFTQALCDFCALASNSKLTSMNFLRWLNEPTQRALYPVLTQWAESKSMIDKLHNRKEVLQFEELAA